MSILFERSVKFRDEDMNLCEIEFQISERRQTGDANEELTPTISICGNMGRYAWQISDEIKPRCEQQKKLIEFWGKYHLKTVEKGVELEKIVAEIIGMCNDIEEEEAEFSESLSDDDDFDMGAEDFKATDEIIEKVMELEGLGEYDAMAFIALGMYLECTYQDLSMTFRKVSDLFYKANGRHYWIGTMEDLQSRSKDHVFSGEYDYCWKEAVQNDSTEDSKEDFLESLLEYDGWASILGSYDGNYREYSVGDFNICVIRN